MKLGSFFWGFPFVRKTQGEQILKSVREVIVCTPIERSIDDLKNAIILKRTKAAADLDHSSIETDAQKLLDRLKAIKDNLNRQITDAEINDNLRARIEKENDVKMLGWVDDFLDRLTNKSVGLLQALSVPTAILTIYQTQEPSTVTGLFVALLFFVALLLLWNLRVIVWKPLDAYADPKLELQHCLKLIRFRSARLMISIYLGAIGLIGGALFIVFPHLAGEVGKLL